MRNKIFDKLMQLKSLDQTCQIFGADYHQYRLNPVTSAAEISAAEERLGVTLPADLARYFAEVGNGRSGPYYGINELADLRGYQSEKPYQGVEYFKQLAKKQGVPEDEDGYFEVRKESIQGLVTIIHEGCGHEICLVTTGENRGKPVHVSCDGFVTESPFANLAELYVNWLDANLAAFAAVEKLIHARLQLNEIEQRLNDDFNRYDGKDLVVSFIGAEKPPKLFGTRSHRIYHRAGQSEWYAEQLAQYRGKK